MNKAFQYQESHRFDLIYVFSRETVRTNITAGQPVPSMRFPVLYGIYRPAINQSNFSKLGPYELVI